MAKFEPARRHAQTAHGEIAFVEAGQGPAALFVHGLMMSASLWRPVLTALASDRRCIAVDLLGHGHTRASADLTITLGSQAEMLADLCEVLDLAEIDLVANDFGGAVAQTLAVRHPDRLRSLTLTNCDVHDNLGPPAALAEVRPLAERGELAPLIAGMPGNVELARAQFPGRGFEDPRVLSAEVLREFLYPAFAPPGGGREFERMLLSIEGDELTAIEPRLRALEVPTLMVWGTEDTYFPPEWAHWLAATIAGPTRVTEIEGARLFFPYERPQVLVGELRAQWAVGIHA
jgi:pimeloyl-ACP methyl ester carboxylesterase